MYGWYSDKMANIAGAHVYKTNDGQEVIVTTVCATPNHGCMWDDMRLVSDNIVDDPTAGYVRRIQSGSESLINPDSSTSRAYLAHRRTLTPAEKALLN